MSAALAPIVPLPSRPPAPPAPSPAAPAARVDLAPRRRPWARRNLWKIGLALLVFAAAVAAWPAYRRLHRPPAPVFETAAVDRGRIVARVTATGTLSALVTVQVGSQVSGRVQELKVDFNSRVKK